MNVFLEVIEEKYLRLTYQSKYASGSIPINTPKELVDAIEEVCGRGSYCLYFPLTSESRFAESIAYGDYDKYPNLPRLTYWQQGVKTQVIEQCRKVAETVWGDIPEMKIGWLENQCKTYIE